MDSDLTGDIKKGKKTKVLKIETLKSVSKVGT